LAEIEKKKQFMGKIKDLIHLTNFSVGTHEASFDRKENATVDNPDFQAVVTPTPKPHKNISTMKIKYHEGQRAFAKPHSHSKTMDINRVDFMTLAMNQRPKILTHLKHTSIKFTSGHKESAFDKKATPFRSNAFSNGFRASN
jgi:hypothetical protein